MRTIAIDTSAKSISVAVLQDQETIFELDSTVYLEQKAKPESGTLQQEGQNAGALDQLPPGYVKKRSKRGSKTSRVFAPGASVLLAPMIKEAFEKSNVRASEIELVAVSVGPGLFTGLRVGVVTAKSLAYSIGAELIGVNTLETIAAQTIEAMDNQSEIHNVNRVVRPVLNAQRKQLFCGRYIAGAESNWAIDQSKPDEILDRKEWINGLQPNDVVSGLGLAPVVEQVQTQCPGVLVAPESTWQPTAAPVGKLALSHFQSGRRDDLWKLEPVYFRPSAAEEVRAAKNL